MRRHSVITLGAVGAVVALGATAVPANAATAKPARGSAQSTLNLIQLQVGDKVVKAVDALGLASTLSGAAASLNLVPVNVAGTTFGATKITPASGSKTVSAPSAPALPGGLAQLTSPVLQAAASLANGGALTTLGATSLGSAKVLGLPLALTGTLTQSAAASKSNVASTGLKLTSFSLPSVADLLAALGLDIKALPVSTLNRLLTELQLPTAGLSAANAAVTAAQNAANSTIDRLRSATANLASKQGLVTTATATLNQATTALNNALNGIAGPVLALAGLGSVPTAAIFQTLTPLVQGILTTAVPALTALDAAFDAAKAAVTLATGAAQAALGLVSSLSSLGNLVMGVLDGTPLASIASIDLTAMSSAGDKLASTVTGTVSGIKVLGLDVLKSVTGKSSIDAAKLLGGVSAQVQAATNGVLGTLDTILSSVAGVAGLNLPLPQIKVLDIVKSAQKFANGSQDALASVSALTLNIPAFSVPSALALPNALNLPGLSAVTGGVLGKAIKLSVGTISQHSTFLPAGVNATGTVVKNTPSITQTPAAPTGLASTGSNPAIAILAMVTVGLAGAAGLARRKVSLASKF